MGQNRAARCAPAEHEPYPVPVPVLGPLLAAPAAFHKENDNA
jgi:hypothetical protein